MRQPPTLADLFLLLDQWRGLPAYRMEPRVDAFAALFLRGLLEERTRMAIHPEVIPEFPLRRGMLHGEAVAGPNMSKKVDFAFCSADRSVVHLVELKTDQGSRNDEQDDYLRRAANLPFAQVLKGIREIVAASGVEYTAKYRALTECLRRWGFDIAVDGAGQASPTAVQIWYVQPVATTREEIGFAELARYMRSRGGEVATTIAPYFEKWEKPPHAPPA